MKYLYITLSLILIIIIITILLVFYSKGYLSVSESDYVPDELGPTESVIDKYNFEIKLPGTQDFTVLLRSEEIDNNLFVKYVDTDDRHGKVTLLTHFITEKDNYIFAPFVVKNDLLGTYLYLGMFDSGGARHIDSAYISLVENSELTEYSSSEISGVSLGEGSVIVSYNILFDNNGTEEKFPSKLVLSYNSNGFIKE